MTRPRRTVLGYLDQQPGCRFSLPATCPGTLSSDPVTFMIDIARVSSKVPPSVRLPRNPVLLASTASIARISARMWPHEEVQVAKVRAALTELALSDICPRCVLRLAGLKRSAVIIESDPLDPSLDSDDGPDAKRSKVVPPPLCRACLGVMQAGVMHEALQAVSDELKDCPYDASQFTLAISLPTSLALRAHSLNTLLSEKIETFYDGDVVPIKQAWKWVFAQKFQEVIGKKFVSGDFCQFLVEFQVNFDEDEAETQCLMDMCQSEYSKRQKQARTYHMGLVTRVGLEKSLSDVSDEKFRKHYPVPPNIPKSQFKPTLKMVHNSIFLAGRYNKYSRELPQTPWLVDGERKAESSVEELLMAEVKPSMVFDSFNFSSSGREDVDVRMLGMGRPFMFELVNPRKTMFKPEEMADIQCRINAHSTLVQVRDLQIVSKSDIVKLKEGEDQKKKTYRALCAITPAPGQTISWDKVKEQLEGIKDLELSQRTPIRVLHRRPNAIRRRTVYFMEVTPLSEDQFILRLASQAGTYIKEFVHGDFARTQPNLNSILGTNVDILALDVEEIDLVWPPPPKPS